MLIDLNWSRRTKLSTWMSVLIYPLVCIPVHVPWCIPYTVYHIPCHVTCSDINLIPVASCISIINHYPMILTWLPASSRESDTTRSVTIARACVCPEAYREFPSKGGRRIFLPSPFVTSMVSKSIPCNRRIWIGIPVSVLAHMQSSNGVKHA